MDLYPVVHEASMSCDLHYMKARYHVTCILNHIYMCGNSIFCVGLSSANGQVSGLSLCCSAQSVRKALTNSGVKITIPSLITQGNLCILCPML